MLTDRAQGGGVITPGAPELMVHRRTMQDDSLGVGEPLREPGIDGRGLVVRGVHHLWVSRPELASRSYRRRALELNLQPLIVFYDLSKRSRRLQLQQQADAAYSALQRALPDNVHMLTLENWDSGSKLLRLEHIYQRNEDKYWSQDVVINLKVRMY